MDARGLVRAVRTRTTVRSAWRKRRADAAGLPPAGTERARGPGEAQGAEPRAGGGVITFARSALRVRVAVGGGVFCGWDGARPEPSYALAGRCPEADVRAQLEPDTDGGWRVVSERVLVTVSRFGAVELRTPGGALLRRELPPRWWERDTPQPSDTATTEPDATADTPTEAAAAGASPAAPWLLRSEVPADARFFGLGATAAGPRLPDGTYRLWNTDPGSIAPGDGPLHLTMPAQLVVADAGTHLVFYDNTWDGRIVLREGDEGRGSGHDRPGRCEIRFTGGPLRFWVLTGAPSRVLYGWTALTGPPALPPTWALGHQHARDGGAQEARRTAAAYRERGLPLRALHLQLEHCAAHPALAVDHRRYPDLPALAAQLGADGVRLVAGVSPAVQAGPDAADGERGVPAGAFVTDGSGREVRGVLCRGSAAFPDFTDPRVRSWWSGLYTERLAAGLSGVWHSMNEPTSRTAFGAPTFPLSARHVLEGRGGDHREAHNVYALTMAQAAHAGLCERRPQERPFLLSRSGWAGIQRYGGTWSPGAATGWPGLRTSLSLVLGLGLSGVPYSGPDIGGATAAPDGELYLRWFQLGAFLPLFRTNQMGRAGHREPWEFGRRTLEHCAAALAERERLLPYFVTLSHLAHRTGAPYVRPLWWQHPGDRALRDCQDAFLLGDALLVAPVLEPGGRERAVRLPRGRWYDTATGQSYEGPGEVRVAAPLSRIPVLARAGAAVPVTGETGATELEVWPPAPGRTGSGLVIPHAGDGWEHPEAERFRVRLRGGHTVVEPVGGGSVDYPVRVRG